ncbi:nucleotidyltransferase domain-containing protein [Umezawaea beigongshangensis]|uniref:nucleotidyltransferase domain-containing protein n=1 Tax=Umezawaea beigongshangensis TaxID=2780383 RepID=UPI0018F12116|nr:nucleotidyltransferase domain-containing protein [Umezawaea beigongshangensis]
MSTRVTNNKSIDTNDRESVISRALKFIDERNLGDSLATMLYGSYARGTEVKESDIDLLQLVERSPKAYDFNHISVTQYTPLHLKIMAQEGSLFVLHLKIEGISVYDHKNILAGCLNEYTAPKSYDLVKEELAIAARALNPSLLDTDQHLKSLTRLGIYILRTLAYIKCTEAGTPTFDIDNAEKILQDKRLTGPVQNRRKWEISPDNLQNIYDVIVDNLPSAEENRYKTLEEIAVANSHYRHASALIANVISGSKTIDYAALALPPL